MLQIMGIWLTELLGYLAFLHLNMHAKMVLTDSGERWQLDFGQHCPFILSAKEA